MEKKSSQDSTDQITSKLDKASNQKNRLISLSYVFRSIFVFVIFPIILFTIVGFVEHSFFLPNSGLYFTEQGTKYGIEQEKSLFVLVGETKELAQNFPKEHIEQTWTSDSGQLIFTQDFIATLPRCPKEGIAHHSCMITNNGIFEDPIFLGYFFAVFFMILAAYNLLNGIKSLHASIDRLIVKTKTSETEEEPLGGLSNKELEDLLHLCMTIEGSFLPWRRPHMANELSGKHQRLYKNLRYIPFIISLGGTAYLAKGTYQHLYPMQSYGFDIWASGNYPFGFYSRFFYEAILYVVFFPTVFYWLFLSIFIMHHLITYLEEKNAVRFIRFSFDEAHGMGEFGNQSLRNILILMPLLLPIIAYILFYPVTDLLIAGMLIFVIALPFIFYWPLLGARRSLIRLKQNEIKVFTKHYEQSYNRLKEVLSKDPDNLVLVKDTSEALLAADQVFKELNDLSTWPFSRPLIAKFASLMTILLSGLAILLEKL